jgi:DNA modification methylase
MLGPFPLDTVVCLEALAFVGALPPESVDCFWFSPPFNLKDKFRGGNSVQTGVKRQYRLGSGRGDGAWVPEAVYQAQQVALLDACARALKPRGVVWYSHKPRPVDKRLILPTEWTQRSRLTLIQQIVWRKPSTAQGDPRRFFPVHELLLLLAKRPGWYVANPGKQSGGEGLQDVWQVRQSAPRDQTGHECPTPEEIVRRCLALTAILREREEDGRCPVVVDPYAGSGTTGVVARRLGCAFLLNDHDPDFVAAARARLDGVDGA